MNTNTRHKSAIACAVALLMAAGAARAERPMNVDDAGTLPQGGAKLEFGWGKDGQADGFEGAVGYGPIETLEVELNFARTRDGSLSPREVTKTYGAAIKWVPLSMDNGLSAGLKYEYGHDQVDGGASTDVQTVLALVSFAFEAGPVGHLNLGREWSRFEGDREAVNVWGIGFDVPMTDAFHFTVETFGAEHSGPERAIGLRYEIVEGLKLSGAIGRGNNRTFANVGVAWEF